jgi:hypothetical protein
MVRPGDTFFDVWSNIGQYGLYAELKMRGAVGICCFEPEATTPSRIFPWRAIYYEE